MSKASVKKAERERLQAELKTILAKAQAGACAASQRFINTAPRNTDGHIKDTAGYAFIYVRRPSYRLREALKALDAVRRGANGAWILKGEVAGLASIGLREQMSV